MRRLRVASPAKIGAAIINGVVHGAAVVPLKAILRPAAIDQRQVAPYVQRSIWKSA